jgi:hypothetical protein
MSIIAIAAALLLAQAPAEPQKKADSNQPVTLNGCVVREAANGSSYTFTDATNGLKYKLAGKSVSRYSGMSLEVVGIVDRRNLKVYGGLWPSTNVAAQAGAIDPGKAAVAALPGGGASGTGSVDLPTLRVTRVGVASGECKQ